MISFDLSVDTLRSVNEQLHKATAGSFEIHHPDGAHAIAAGLTAPLEVTVQGSAGYYCAGMNSEAMVRVNGMVGTGVAENMMSGTVVVAGNAGQSAGATAHGGLLVIRGNASARCGISLKGADIVVGGSVGHMSCFMAQAGNVLVLGDAGADLGDSLYEVNIYVRGDVAGLGADCEAKDMDGEHRENIARLLTAAALADPDRNDFDDVDPDQFTRYGSARKLYNFEVDDVNAVAASRRARQGASS